MLGELINSVYLIPSLFPTASAENRVICVSGIGNPKPFSVIITDSIPDLHVMGAANPAQCFPLYSYGNSAERKEKDPDASQTSLFTSSDTSSEVTYQRKDGISDFIHAKAKTQYHTTDLTKEDIFYYVYGILHSPTYRETFSADLKKMLPRIPLVSSYDDFIAFSQAGRELADMHLHYETVEPYADTVVTGTDSGNFRVTKMRFLQKGQKDTILYNTAITVSNIPEKAYQYIVNGKSAIEWIMEWYQITIDKRQRHQE